MHTFAVAGSDVTSAWIAACKALDRKDNPARTGYHTVVRIADATADDPAFRAELERVRAHAAERQAKNSYKPIETVASTIFPAALASHCGTHEQLVTRYRDLYTRAKRYPGNHHDMYFGRLVAYPGIDGTQIDQIGKIIGRLTQQAASKAPMTAAYESGVAHPADTEAALLLPDVETTAPAEARVHVPGRDNLIRGFPCLSHCSFQLDRSGTVHAAAFYRSHYMLERAYGNYLGLGRLTAYIASRAGLRPGTLTVMAGYAQLEGPVTPIRTLLNGITPMLAV
ncbi:hypothetical protein CU044_1040 [Streptomyces sp. L-9-10]|uniref:hypothetical protein n=1 Tax=Streptomyces sp. L-9-10 TaxID=1478131 RepID=UPI00101D49B0|nr:hypothetical protein [Streptomyces sp. L-9-10]RYJ30697.1 hypothetical protein CU044_1040 [Streptomyces sp. L-9-10]